MSKAMSTAMSTAKGATEVIAALLAQAEFDLQTARLGRQRGWEIALTEKQSRCWWPGPRGRCSGSCGVRASSAWPAPTSAATSTSRATSPAGLRLVHAYRPRSGPFGLIKTGPAAVAAAARLGLLAPPPAPPRCELRVRGRLDSRARDQAR